MPISIPHLPETPPAPALLPHILIVEDDPTAAETYAEFARRLPARVTTTATGQAALQFLQTDPPDAIILDLHLTDMHGCDILNHVSGHCAGLPVIVISGDKSPDSALEAIRCGASDFIQKPFLAARLWVTLRHVLEHSELKAELAAWQTLLTQQDLTGFIGRSAAMLKVCKTIAAVAASKTTVLITGESGTGKEVAARALHSAGPRKNKPFIPVNCAAIPADLMESALFGHVRGAFTGATTENKGAATHADGGTLFLDEIGELPLGMQTKLLRFLQTGEVQQVGNAHIDKVDTRIVAATNRDLAESVKAGTFREDLFYRLHIVPIEMPPLRERPEDILPLAHHFLRKYSAEEGKNFTGFSANMLPMLWQNSWPGNVRQLENMIRAAVAMNTGSELTPEMFPAFKHPLPSAHEALTIHPEQNHKTDSFSPAPDYQSLPTHAHKGMASPNLPPPLTTPHLQPLWQIEKTAILSTLQHTQNDVAKAAQILEINTSTLYRKLKQWNIQ